MATKNDICVVETDINTKFDEHISLYNLVGQNRASDTLVTLIDEYYWGQAQGISSKITPVMLYGQHSCSVVARAYANTLGAVEYNEIMGCLIGFGVNLQDCFGRMDEHCAYYISDIDKMVYYWQHHLYTLVKNKIIEIPEIPNYRTAETKYLAGQLVISAEKPTKITSKLERHCAVVIKLEDHQDEDIEDILMQRIAVCGITVNDKYKIVDAIVQAAKKDVKLAIQMLDWACKCSRAEGKEMVLLRHLNKALRMRG